MSSAVDVTPDTTATVPQCVTEPGVNLEVRRPKMKLVTLLIPSECTKKLYNSNIFELMFKATRLVKLFEIMSSAI